MVEDKSSSSSIFEYDLQVNFGDAEIAKTIKSTLEIDKEISSDLIREIIIDGPLMITKFKSTNPRLLRNAVKGYSTSMTLSLDTISRFQDKK